MAGGVRASGCSKMLRTGALHLNSNGGSGGGRNCCRASWKDNRVHYVDDFEGKIAFPVVHWTTTTGKVSMHIFLSRTSEWFFIIIITFPLRRRVNSFQSVVRRTTRPPRTNQSLFTCCAVGRWSVCGHNNLWANNYDSVCVTRAASSSVSDYCGKRISQIVCCAPLV